ncbi:MAG TPA: STAS/SEC14 domain-containing protein [Cyclobacteriaceae bacterium]|nr:STAS/SEC14 domain-containing protein [Cyclobacteriaceae bacterium]
MTPPINAKIYEGELADFWFDAHGILCAVSKMVPRTHENQLMNYELIRQITGGKRVCLLADNTLTYEQDDATRKLMATEIPKVFKAMAVFSRTIFGQAVSDTFLYYQGTPVPIKTFKNEEEARQWLQQHLGQ